MSPPAPSRRSQTTPIWGIFFNEAAYSPDGLRIYMSTESGTGPLEFDGTSFREIGVSAGQLNLSFDPTDASVFAVREGGVIRFYDVRDPLKTLELVGVGGTSGRVVHSFSWTRR